MWMWTHQRMIDETTRRGAGMAADVGSNGNGQQQRGMCVMECESQRLLVCMHMTHGAMRIICPVNRIRVCVSAICVHRTTKGSLTTMTAKTKMNKKKLNKNIKRDSER